MDETRTLTFWPGLRPAGIVASTRTTAMFAVVRSAGSMLMLRARSEFASSCVARAPESPVPARPETTPMPTTSLSSIPRTPTRLRTWEKTRESKSRPTRAVFPRRGKVVKVALDLRVGWVGAWIEGTGVTIAPDCALAAVPAACCAPATGASCAGGVCGAWVSPCWTRRGAVRRSVAIIASLLERGWSGCSWDQKGQIQSTAL